MNAISWVLLGFLAVISVAALLGVRHLAAKLARLERRLAQLTATVSQLTPAIEDTRLALREVESRHLRADDLVQAATGLATRADAASQLAFSVATTPVVRALAIARGVRRGVGALRPSRPEQQQLTDAASLTTRKADRS